VISGRPTLLPCSQKRQPGRFAFGEQRDTHWLAFTQPLRDPAYRFAPEPFAWRPILARIYEGISKTLLQLTGKLRGKL
jgi:hypothetical protein